MQLDIADQLVTVSSTINDYFSIYLVVNHLESNSKLFVLFIIQASVKLRLVRLGFQINTGASNLFFSSLTPSSILLIRFSVS